MSGRFSSAKIPAGSDTKPNFCARSLPTCDDATTARPRWLVPPVRVQTDAQTSRRRVAARVLICRNSGGTIIRCSRSHANHSVALNYSERRVLFMTAFSHATGKFARAGFAGRNRAAKAFHKDRTAFISHRPGRLWDAGFTFARRALSFIYSQDRVGSCRVFFVFFQCVKHLTCYVEISGLIYA